MGEKQRGGHGLAGTQARHGTHIRTQKKTKKDSVQQQPTDVSVSVSVTSNCICISGPSAWHCFSLLCNFFVFIFCLYFLLGRRLGLFFCLLLLSLDASVFAFFVCALLFAVCYLLFAS